MDIGTLTDETIDAILKSVKIHEEGPIPKEEPLYWVPQKQETLTPTYGPIPKTAPIIDLPVYLKDPEKNPYLFSGGHRPSYDEVNDYKDDIWKAKQDFTNLSDKRFIPARGSFMGGILGFTEVGKDYQVINIDMPWRHMKLTQIHEIGHQDSEYLTRIITEDRLNIQKEKRYKK
jgi:hypothetical protein